MQDSVGGPRLWLLQGKTAGDNAQVLALGESLTAGTGWQAEIKSLSPDLRQAAKRRWPKRPALDQFAASEMSPPWPDVVIACGRTPCIVAQWLKELAGGRLVHVQLGRLGVKPQAIDLVLETAQYGVAPTANMISLTLPIVRRDSVREAAAVAAWENDLNDLPRPWLGVLVGGPASPIPFEAADGSRLLRRITELKRRLGGSLLIAYGPRTPNPVREILELGLSGDRAHRVFGWPPPQPNPYPALLALADRFLVTCDSASMIADACVTGKPVEVFMLTIPEYLTRFSSRGLGFSLDARRRRRHREGLAPDFLDRFRDFLVTERLLFPYRDMRDLLHVLNKAAIVGSLGASADEPPVAGRGKALQAREIDGVKQRIIGLIRARQNGTAV
ncbi:ELM1/GtrOC1 family putative glycosyltransferase [Dongia sedimenti]|uniref:ELM1/GtrOC1 family putative glycosyltransferase n=1 Tax=Dongia sedimenti TaxID=3064282 RepID=A0ABU0YL85_9PROT|nr:ELM1/GtrOC1 family putative glycosyltransferase [Rhodospirillaceae bacterium R-7]